MLTEVILVFIIIILCIASIVPADSVDLRWKTIKRIYKLPGLKGFPFVGLGYLAATTKDPELLDVLQHYYKKYDRMIASYLVGIPLIVLKTPEDLETVLGSTIHIEKGMEYDPVRPWLNEGLLVSSGGKWHQRRKLLTPAFHFKILEDNLQSVNKHARHLLRNMLKMDGTPFNANQLITLCTLDVICETAMGFSMNTQDDQDSDYMNRVKKVAEMVVTKVRKFWLRKEWIWTALGYSKIFNNDLKQLHDFTEQIILERKNSNYSNENNKVVNEEEEPFIRKNRKAFLDILLDIDRKNPDLLKLEDIREEVDTFMFEGHDTTSAAIVFALLELGTHPEIQEKAYQEQISIFGDSDRAVTTNDLRNMPYLEMVIKETLRLYPSVPYISRKLKQELHLDGLEPIPEGVNIIMVPYLLHHDPTYYPNPQKFDPERFTFENSKTRHPFAYLPFSAGPRNCIGQKFAMLELKIILSTLIRFSKIESLTKPKDIKLLPFLILRPHKPIMIKCTPRSKEIE